jgi:ribosomal protein S18 acetylase RimI-like enzyme
MDNDRVVGTCTLGPYDECHLHLFNLIVAPTHRKKGIARQLFRLARRYAKFMSMILYVRDQDQQLIPMYKKFGAKEEPSKNKPGYKAMVVAASGRVTGR